MTPRPGGAKQYIAAVDVGTTMVKAALFDEAGEAVRVAEAPASLRHGPAGRVEQDAEDVVQLVGTVLLRLGKGSPVRPRLLALTGQGDGCWLLDGTGHSVRPAISWLDGRAADTVDDWDRRGVLDEVYQLNGNALFPGSQAAVLRWLEDHEPASLDDAVTAAYCKETVFQRLTGQRLTDLSDSSLPFGDPAGGYSSKILDLCGLSGRAGLLAPVAEPVPAAPLTTDGSDLTGLPTGTAVVSSPFDLVACMEGTGSVSPGDGLLILGTTLACEVTVDRIDTSGPVAGMHLRTTRPGRWVRSLPAMVGCASLDWVLDLVGQKPSDLGQCLARSAPGAGGTELLPYLSPSGERAPFVDTSVRGHLTGLQLTTTREDVVRATCEGIALAARDCFACTEVRGPIAVCGGGSQSREWVQIIADVLGQPLQVAGTPHVGVRGAALAAAGATGQEISADHWVAPSYQADPDPAQRNRYDDAYGRYCERRDAARRRLVP